MHQRECKVQGANVVDASNGANLVAQISSLFWQGNLEQKSEGWLMRDIQTRFICSFQKGGSRDL